MIKLGLIGAGSISQAHCRSISQIEGAEIIAASDLVPANLERMVNNWGLAEENTFADYNEMLKMDEIEAVWSAHRPVFMPHQRSLPCRPASMFYVKNRWKRPWLLPPQWRKQPMKPAKS